VIVRRRPFGAASLARHQRDYKPVSLDMGHGNRPAFMEASDGRKDVGAFRVSVAGGRADEVGSVEPFDRDDGDVGVVTG